MKDDNFFHHIGTSCRNHPAAKSDDQSNHHHVLYFSHLKFSFQKSFFIARIKKAGLPYIKLLQSSTCDARNGSVWQPGYLLSLRPVAFRPHLTMGLALSIGVSIDHLFPAVKRYAGYGHSVKLLLGIAERMPSVMIEQNNRNYR
jgi:hypothetical protein